MIDHGEISLGFYGHKRCSGQRIVEGLQMGKIPSIHCEWSFFGVLDKSVQEASSMNPRIEAHVVCPTTVTHASRHLWVSCWNRRSQENPEEQNVVNVKQILWECLRNQLCQKENALGW